MQTIHILSGGAAQGLVRRLGDTLAARGLQVQGQFGAVGAMRDLLLAGTPCDLLVLSQALIDDLAAQGRVVPGSARPVGRVRTGIALPDGQPLQATPDGATLAALLRRASAVYFPDPVKATAGIHFMNVLRQLKLDQELAARLRTFPNGATAMRAMADSGDAGAVGCTQFTEILETPGVQLAGPLPPAFELATVYTAAVPSTAAAPEAGAAVAALLAGSDAAAARAAAGFDPL
jgi:molybdate transport system substrate-binding protein